MTGVQACCNCGGGNRASVDCVGQWDQWSACSETCGDGTQTKSYSITVDAESGGNECPHAQGDSETRTCNLGACPVDCVGQWGQWSTCSETCGDGTETKSYSTSVDAANGGNECPHAQGDSETRTCNLGACPVDCVGQWGQWGACSETCGFGTQTKSYSTSVDASNGGDECSHAQGDTETQTCNLGACPVHCVGQWGEWSACSETCGDGTQSKSYLISINAANGGDQCPHAHFDTETRTCNLEACPEPTTTTTTEESTTTTYTTTTEKITDAPTTNVEVNGAESVVVTDPCLCPEGTGWSRSKLGCFEDSTTACDECPTMERCEAGSCANGCYGYMPMRLCQCTPSCLEFGNCCQDSQPCMTCQEESWCSENIPCNGLCSQQNTCPCTCGHIPTQSPSPSPTATVCDVSQEQDFCQDVPCEELCDPTLCPCTCPDVGTRNDTTILVTPDETLLAMDVIPNPILQTITQAVTYPLALCGAFASIYYMYQFINKQTAYTEVQAHEEI